MNSKKKLNKKTKLILVKQKREQKHNFIEVKSEITYGESIVNKSRAGNLVHLHHFTIDVAYVILVICVSCKT